MIQDVRRLISEYLAWLRDKTLLREINDQWIEITTPFMDRHNDYLQIYARRDNGGFLLTDDGYTIQDLEQSGCKLDSHNRKSLLQVTLNGFGVKLNNEAMEVHASENDFPLRKHNLLQAMLAVNDLFYLAEPHVSMLFNEDVAAWLDTIEVRYTPRVKFTGKSGFDHLFHFVIPKSKVRPERILQAIKQPSRDTALSLAFAWFDTREVRARDSTAIALLNDINQPVASSVVDALRSYEVKPVLWSQKDAVREELAA